VGELGDDKLLRCLTTEKEGSGDVYFLTKSTDTLRGRRGGLNRFVEILVVWSIFLHVGNWFRISNNTLDSAQKYYY
jgi:hypothetical protein